MKTSDFTKTTSKQVNETIEKTFGKKINLESFTLDQLQDARNRLRTQLSQKRDNSRFDENIESDAYYQAQFMLDALNREISEREEFAVVAQEVNEAKAGYCSDDCCGSDVKAEDCTCAPSCPHCDCNKTNESVNGEEMKDQVTEGELQQASAIVTAKTMVDKIARYIEELSGMENETLIQLGDAIRDEIGDQQAKAFIEGSAPAIQQAIETMKATRDSLGSATRVLAGEESPTDMLGAEPDAMNAEPEADMGAEAPEAEVGDEIEGAGDDFAAAEPAAGGMETAGREQRESIDRQTNLLRILAG